MTAARFAGRALLAALALMFALNVAWAFRHAADLRPVAGGSSAPAFDLPLFSGGRYRLSPGHVTVVDFWASWCEPCRAEMPTVARLAARYRPRGVDFVAVNIEDPSAAPQIAAYLRSANLDLPFALDGGPTASRYRVDTIPHLVIIAPNGQIARVLVGPAAESTLAAAIDEALSSR